MRRKVDEYGSYVEAAVTEFNELAEASENRELTALQAERLIELDGMVEALRGKGVAVPGHLKGAPLEVIGDLIERRRPSRRA